MKPKTVRGPEARSKAEPARLPPRKRSRRLRRNPHSGRARRPKKLRAPRIQRSTQKRTNSSALWTPTKFGGVRPARELQLVPVSLWVDTKPTTLTRALVGLTKARSQCGCRFSRTPSRGTSRCLQSFCRAAVQCARDRVDVSRQIFQASTCQQRSISLRCATQSSPPIIAASALRRSPLGFGRR